MAVVEKEPDYDDIYGGEWLTGKSKNYFAVHRVCVADAFKRRRTDLRALRFCGAAGAFIRTGQLARGYAQR